MTTKEKVLKVWTQATAWKGFHSGLWAIQVSDELCTKRLSTLCDSEEAAWQNAAESLPAQPEQEKCGSCAYVLPDHFEGCFYRLVAEANSPEIPDSLTVEAKEKCGVICPDDLSLKCNLLAGHYQEYHSDGHTDWLTSEPKPTPSTPDQKCRFCPQLKSEHEPDGRCYNLLTSAKFEPQPDSSSIPDQICNEILDIMKTYHEHSNSAHGVDTPGGLEHMGDVWGLFHAWELRLKAADKGSTETEGR